MNKNQKKIMIRGGIIGFLLGFLHRLIQLYSQYKSNFLTQIYNREFLLFCNIFGFEIDEACSWAYIIWGLFIYLVLGLIFGILVGYVIYKLRSRKSAQG